MEQDDSIFFQIEFPSVNHLAIFIWNLFFMSLQLFLSLS